MDLQLSHLPSPLAELLVVSDGSGCLYALDFADYEARMRRLLAQYHGDRTLQPGEVPQPVRAALASYFQGELQAVSELPVATAGSDFQQRVWQALRDIPPGETSSYGALAASLGNPNASRAVGLANGNNPIAIVIPCHRVIGKNGSLTGYAGGLARKRWLLEHEARHHTAGTTVAVQRETGRRASAAG